MTDFIKTLTDFNAVINDFVWVKIGLFLLVGTGIFMSCMTKFFQISHAKHWWKKTIGSMFEKDSSATRKNNDGSVSQFQALCTALAATLGTGNIAGVSAAIVVGGAGAVFWMWIAAFLGMMTSFSEKTLGVYYRRKNENDEWIGGAMYYLQDGLGKIKGCKYFGKILAVLFALFTIFASFGIGNMGQINKITLNLEDAFFSKYSDIYIFGNVKLVPLIIGIILMIIAGLIILGGIQRIANVSEKIVPFMAIAYIIGSLVIIVLNIDKLGLIFSAIFKCAFGIKAVGGGIAGVTIKTVVTQGCKRGVFSNEAGLGSSVMVHASANVVEPVKQGMWGIFEVFVDTIVVCTMTAIVVLSSGKIDLATGMAYKGINDATLIADTFEMAFGPFGKAFIAIAILLFAFTTVLGWSHYGSTAVEYLFGTKAPKIYRVVFVIMIVSGSIMSSSIAWDISDTFNGLMMIPNLIGILVLSPTVVKILNNYINRRLKGSNEAPIISYDENIQKMQEKKLAAGEE